MQPINYHKLKSINGVSFLLLLVFLIAPTVSYAQSSDNANFGWGQVISIILGSSVLAAVFGFVADGWRDRRKGEIERKEKLYGPLRFHLMHMEKNFKLRQELLKSRHEAGKKWGYTGANYEQLEKKFSSDNTELIDVWWLHAEKVIKLFEDNPKYIKDGHWSLVEKLFESYLFRKVVSGEKTQKPFWLYDDATWEKDTKNEFVVTLNELYEKIKNG